MRTPRWTPEAGTLALVERLGATAAQTLLGHLAYWPRSWAARSLGHLGDDDAAPALVNAFADPHWRVRVAAARALVQLAAEGYDDELATLVADPHPHARAAAVMTLGRMTFSSTVARTGRGGPTATL